MKRWEDENDAASFQKLYKSLEMTEEEFRLHLEEAVFFTSSLEQE